MAYSNFSAMVITVYFRNSDTTAFNTVSHSQDFVLHYDYELDFGPMFLKFVPLNSPNEFWCKIPAEKIVGFNIKVTKNY